MMALKINNPVFIDNYERYRIELEAWREITELPKAKQGIAVALSLPPESSSDIRDKVFEQLPITDLKANGFGTLLAFLDRELQKDDISAYYGKLNDFEEFRRSPDQSIHEYITKFDQLYNRIAKCKMNLPSSILAFKLLKCANLTTDEHMIVLSGINYDEANTLYEQAKKSLKKYKGDQVATKNTIDTVTKLDAAYLAENEEVLLAARYIRKPSIAQQPHRSCPDFSNRFNNYNFRRDKIHPQQKLTRSMNPKGADGSTLTCISCGYYRHLLPDCPHSWENMQANVVETDNIDEEEVVLFTGSLTNEIRQLGSEATNCAVLDSACSSTVCGENWLSMYFGSLDSDLQNNIKKTR